MTFEWFNWCSVAPIGALQIALTLPQGGTLELSSPGGSGLDPLMPRCDAPNAASTLGTFPFQQTPGPSPTQPPETSAERLRVDLELPALAVVGQTLHYVAALTNASSNAINLRPCPAYRQTLVTAKGRFALDFVLNCAAVPSIQPGQTIRFAMELEIPPTVSPTDEAALVWELDPYASQGFLPRGPAQKRSIRIVAEASVLLDLACQRQALGSGACFDPATGAFLIGPGDVPPPDRPPD